MTPYSLDDQQLTDLMTLSAPLPAHVRTRFVEAVLAQAAAQGGAIGAGLLHRIGAEPKTFKATTRLYEPGGATRAAAAAIGGCRTGLRHLTRFCVI